MWPASPQNPQQQLQQDLGNPYQSRPGAPPVEQDFIRETGANMEQRVQQAIMQMIEAQRQGQGPPPQR